MLGTHACLVHDHNTFVREKWSEIMHVGGPAPILIGATAWALACWAPGALNEMKVWSCTPLMKYWGAAPRVEA